ncbi:MAG TPA: DUF4874 domain-containing protein [Polyangiaceae bacterium]|nr:DUF4874 domain-containing protein [Polyangiaceae bacterium]
MSCRGFATAAALLTWPLATAAGCANGSPATCRESAHQLQSLLAKAPRNGAQLGGMTIDSGGIAEGGGAPAAAADAGQGLIRIYVLLSAPGAGLSGAQKSALSGVLSDLQSKGVQAFLRFYYENALTSKANAADSVSKITADIASAKPIVSQYLAIIPFLQAGFLGPWGEWWSGDLEGSDFGSDQELRTLKTGVVNGLKSAFPNTFIQLRYPRDIATYYEGDPQIAFHDDSVLAGGDDGGTFNATKKCPLWPDGDPGKQRAWIKQRSDKLQSVNAGEASESTPDVSCDTLLAYLEEYRIAVFNTQWPAVVTKCTSQLKSSLSYNGPLSPGSGSGSGGAGSGSGGGGGSADPNFGSELGCWAPDQRPWQLCNPKGCDAERCRRAAADVECEMYRAPACKGSWPPAGYPGEETVPTTGGGSGGSGNSGGTGNIGGASGGSGGGTMSSTGLAGNAPVGATATSGGATGGNATSSSGGATTTPGLVTPSGGCP